MAMFYATLSTFTLVNSLNYSTNLFLSVVKIIKFLGSIYIQQMNTICFAWNQSQPASNKFITFSLILLNCQQQTSIYWPYSQVANYVRDRCHITSSLYKTDTSLRRTVDAGPEGLTVQCISELGVLSYRQISYLIRPSVFLQMSR